MARVPNIINYDEHAIFSLTLDATFVRQHWYELLHRVETDGLWVFITHNGVEHQGARIAVLLPYSVAPGAGITVARKVSPRGCGTTPIASLLGIHYADRLAPSP